MALLLEETLAVRELPPGPGHSAHILGMVQAVLAEAGLALNELDCIAFGRGAGGLYRRTAGGQCDPGAGLRGGLAGGPHLGPAGGCPAGTGSGAGSGQRPGLQRCPHAGGVLDVRDARALRSGPGRRPRAGRPPERVQLAPQLPGPLLGAGRGFALWPQLAVQAGLADSQVQAELLPRAREIARLAAPEWLAGRALTPDAAQPVYLRNDVAKPSRK